MKHPLTALVLAWPCLAIARPAAVRLCAPNAKERSAALDELNRTDSLLRKLPATAEPATARAAIEHLLQQRCLALAALDLPGDLSFAKADSVSLRTWWNEGGEEWLASYLTPPGREGLLATTPKGLRPSLTLETASDKLLAPILCADADPTCGAETAGWTVRVERSFALKSELQMGRQDADGPGRTDHCEQQARRAPPTRRYADWYDCLVEHRSETAALPVGRFRAPREGWLVLLGRRGHHEFCDELRTYDLATGTAYMDKSCSALVLRAGGSVDFEATRQRRKQIAQAGHLSVEATREALWMLLLAPYVQRNLRVDHEYHPVPKGIVPVRTPGETSGTMASFFGTGGSDAQTRLKWEWLDGAQVRAAGTLTWPESTLDAEDEVDLLLRAAEATFVEDCPAVPPPALAALPPPPGINYLDAEMPTPAELERRLATAREHLAALAACAPHERVTGSGSPQDLTPAGNPHAR